MFEWDDPRKITGLLLYTKDVENEPDGAPVTNYQALTAGVDNGTINPDSVHIEYKIHGKRERRIIKWQHYIEDGQKHVLLNFLSITKREQMTTKCHRFAYDQLKRLLGAEEAVVPLQTGAQVMEAERNVQEIIDEDMDLELFDTQETAPVEVDGDADRELDGMNEDDNDDDDDDSSTDGSDLDD